MKLQFSLLFTLLSLCFLQCKVQQSMSKDFYNQDFLNNLGPMPIEQGKCFGKCLFMDHYEVTEESYISYDGNEEEENVDVELQYPLVHPSGCKWVRAKEGNNCYLINPDDSLLWCLLEYPMTIKTNKVLLDTTQSSNYHIETYKAFRNVTNKGPYIAWKEIVCEADRTIELIKEVQTALDDAVNSKGSINGIFNQDWKNALVDYQYKFKLPLGQLDKETMAHLGLQY